MADLHEKGFGTRAVHGAGAPDPTTGAVVPAISLASTFAQDAVGQPRAF
jgi:cystathionine beta-lyase/cystathionine gamma-synthase